MQPFLSKVADYLFGRYGNDSAQLCIVTPNRRAGLFLREYWSSHLDRAAWAPSVYAGEDFVAELSGLQLIDTFEQLFTLYSIYKKHKGKKAESFESFARWAPALLADFSEADSWLTDTAGLFGNVGSLKNMETWNPGGNEFTEFQRQYMGFWDSVGIYYRKFREQLLLEGKAYPGLAYRAVSEDVLSCVSTRPWIKIIYAGFHALNASEEKMFADLLAAGKAQVLWDRDSYYMNDAMQEAGHFLRKYREKFPDEFIAPGFVHEENHLAEEEKTITIIGAARRTSQAQAAAMIAEEWLKDENTPARQIAVISGDEHLLLPLLHALPESSGEVNVTMGYPMRNTPIAALAALLLDLHEHARRLDIRGADGELKYHHTDLFRLLHHPYMRLLYRGDRYPDKLATEIAEHNHVFISPSQLQGLLPQMEKSFFRIAPLLRNWTSSRDAFAGLERLTDLLRKLFDGDGNKKKRASVELEFLFQFRKVVRRLQVLSDQYAHLRELRTLRVLLLQAVDSATLPFYGEPVTGLQVMGLLETRALDFENIIIVSANENILPPGRNRNSFIVAGLRKDFGLPSWNDKDAVTAYHFYRLLQRARRVVLIYNTESDAFGSGEKSRFLTQVQYELPRANPKIKVEQRLFSAAGTAPQRPEIIVEKSPAIMQKLRDMAASGFSPSALNSFRTCGLQFYYRYMAGVREHELVEETIGADTMGIVIHAVLEELYTPFKNKAVSSADFENMLAQVAPATAKQFSDRYPSEELAYGKNLLTQHITVKYLNDFLQQEKELADKLHERGQHIFIRELETELTSSVELGGQQFVLRGQADRIDETGHVLRIIDYKTGKADDNELRVSNWFVFNSDVRLNKSFQLLMYALMYVRSARPAAKQLRSGIVSFRELRAGLKTVKTPFGGDNLSARDLDDFEEQLKSLLGQLFDENQSFVQTEDLDRCSICAFREVCNRG
ncbi:MAG: hypothetical protein FD123_2442 [Bacteroidetes bacterium]|nr:MAG: hypothetical protein FD123_2442 [Bacteroidota bacterium]